MLIIVVVTHGIQAREQKAEGIRETPLEVNLDTGILLPLEANEAAEKDITLIPTVVNLELIDMA